MFQVGDYKIVFSKLHGCHNMFNGRYDTLCEIYVGIKPALPRWSGIAKLHPNDQVDRIVGKKVALRNALEKAFPFDDPGVSGLAFELMKADAERKFNRQVIWGAFWCWVSQWPNSRVDLYK